MPPGVCSGEVNYTVQTRLGQRGVVLPHSRAKYFNRHLSLYKQINDYKDYIDRNRSLAYVSASRNSN
jgi:hypothetical protein